LDKNKRMQKKREGNRDAGKKNVLGGKKTVNFGDGKGDCRPSCPSNANGPWGKGGKGAGRNPCRSKF